MEQEACPLGLGNYLVLWDERQRHDVRTLAVAVHELARFQLEKGDPLCADAYREALDLAIAIGDTAAQEICVFSLAKAHHLITDLRNLDEAERWYQRSLEMCALSDDVGRGKDSSANSASSRASVSMRPWQQSVPPRKPRLTSSKQFNFMSKR